MCVVLENMLKSIFLKPEISRFPSFRWGWMKSIRTNKSSSSVEVADDRDRRVSSVRMQKSKPIISREEWWPSKRLSRNSSCTEKRKNSLDYFSPRLTPNTLVVIPVKTGIYAFCHSDQNERRKWSGGIPFENRNYLPKILKGSLECLGMTKKQ